MMRVMWLVVLVCVVVCSAMSRDELEDFTNFLERTSSLDLNVKKGTDPDDAFDEDEEVSDHAWEESGKFEGDLILNDRQRRLIVETVVGLSRNGLKDSTKKWPKNEVIYFIQKEHFNGGQVQAIMDGIDDLARASCVKFRPYRKGDRDAVVIQGSRRGCFSQVGYQGGYQVLNLSGRHPVGRGCFRHGTVVHELLHALGFYHMQSSHDRDDYIDVVWTNIVQPARHNFRKYNSFAVSDFGVGYDYDSVLHYSRRAFSANGQDTLVPKKSGVEIGQRVGLSDKDTQKLNRMYCDADSDSFQADENTTKKPIIKKKPKNQPFEGHGIGYHQGKTVVIKLPVAETYKLANAPSIDVYDFSKTPQAVSTPEDEGYRFGKDITYPYKAPIRLNTDAATGYKNQNNYYEDKPNDSKRLPKEHRASYDDDDTTKLEKNGNITNNSNEQSLNTPTDETDEDLKDAFDRLTSIVKQHVYPQTQIEGYKINKDYSKFYEPPQFKRITMTYKDLLDEKFEKPYETQNNVKLGKYEHDDKHSSKEESDLFMKQNEDIIDESYRTLLPIKKPYSAYQQTETPKYATLEYLRDRQNYSSLYSPKATDSEKTSGPHIILGDKLPPTENDWYKKDSLKHKTPSSNEGFYTDYVSKESKERLTDASNDYDHKTRTKSPTRVKDEYPVEHSNWYYTDYVKKDNERLTDESSDDDENSSERPNKSQAYTKFGSPVSSHWYEPSYTIPTQIRLGNPYSDDTSESFEDNR